MAGVLVIGATGYIGRAVAQAARRDGYTVYAQTRSDSKVSSLAADELVPVVCDPTDADALQPIVDKCEFVVDCTSNQEDPEGISNACGEAIRKCNSISKKHFIYTSGCLVHGDRQGECVAEGDGGGEDGSLAWRLNTEKSLLAITDFDCTVLRPAFVYGRSGGFFSKILFQKPPDGSTLKIAGPAKRWSWVHVDDLADAYVRTMHRRSVAAGRVYDLGEPFGPTYEELRLAGAQLVGFEGEVEYVEAVGFEAFIDMTVVVNSKRAFDELGWLIKHTGITAQLSLYYESYKSTSGGGG